MKRALLTVVWKLRRACSLGLGVLILAFLVAPASAQQRPKVYVLSLDSAVGPVRVDK